MPQPLAKDRHVERTSLQVTRWESGGGGMVSTIADFARYGQMLLNGGTLDGKTYLSPAAFAAMTTDHIGPGSGVARNYFYFPGDGFGFGYGFGVRTDPGNAVPPPPGSLGEIKWDGATGVYLVVDRAEDMFFVVMEDLPSGRMHVNVRSRRSSTTRSRNDLTGGDGVRSMLRKPDEGKEVMMAPARIAALDRARTFITLWCCCIIPCSTTPISAMAIRRAGSASIWSCCSTTVSSWPSCF